MREALVKAAVFCLQSLKWAAGRAGSKIGPRCGPRYGAVSFCGNQNGLQKGAVGGLRRRVGARSLNALACGKPRKLSGAGPSCRRSAESCNCQGPGRPPRSPAFQRCVSDKCKSCLCACFHATLKVGEEGGRWRVFQHSGASTVQVRIFEDG